MINLTINDTKISVPENYTILQAARDMGIHIPTLCHLQLPDTGFVNRTGTCRVCVVEAEGRRNLLPACSTLVQEGMIIRTASRRAILARRTMVELFLSNHPKDCLVCERNRDCELQTLAAELGVREIRFNGHRNTYEKDFNGSSIIRNPEKCVLCRRCETMCNDVQTVGVYSAVHRGFDTVVGTAFDAPLSDTPCTFCGQCVSVCPTAALTEADASAEVWQALADPELFVVAQTAPAVRVTLGESFGMQPGTRVTGKMVSALRGMGFDMVLDTNFAADLTVMEEASELLHRMNHGGRMPMLTSCCPAWVKFIEQKYPDLLDVPSTCKSPHEMFGAVAKTYLCKKLGVDPKKMRVVSIMPCLAKKYESTCGEQSATPHNPAESAKILPQVDFVLSTRETARMIREAGIEFDRLPDRDFDDFMGESTGAGAIFGTSGGVMEAAVRTASAWADGKTANPVFEQLRGNDGIRKTRVLIGGKPLRAAIASGLGNARKLLDQIRAGTHDFDVLEIMACPMGCVGGGGQPVHHNRADILRARAEGLYREDADKPVRMSHENPQIRRIYAEFLGEPFGETAHRLLHTSYSPRDVV